MNPVSRNKRAKAPDRNLEHRIAWSSTKCEKPLIESSRVEAGRIRVRFTHLWGGLAVRGGGRLKGCVIAGADRLFRPARAVIEGETVLVSSPLVPHPVAVRYGWAGDPDGNLANREGLPASPFRTDDWPAVTANVK